MPTVLSAGDIAFVGFNFGNPDEFAFVTLVDIDAGTEVIFTDNGWFAAGGFRETESSFTWTAPAFIAAGTVINPAVSSVALAASGDQIIAYQGDHNAPIFVAAINSEGSNGLGIWQTDAVNSNASALPTGLVDGMTAIALSEIDNAIYSGTTSGTRAALLAAINNPANWTGSNADRQIMPTEAFTVTEEGTEPANSILINEVLASHIGTDDTEFIEISGTARASLEGLSLIVVESDAGTSNGQIDRRIDFTSSDLIKENGFYLIGNPNGLAQNYGILPDFIIGDNFLENSSLTIALVETASLAGSGVAGAEVVIDTVAITDGGAGDSFFFNAPVIGPDGSFFPAGVRRATDFVDTDAASDWEISDFNLGSANTPTSSTLTELPEPSAVRIHEVQGRGASSPLEGKTVTIQAIVVGDYQDGGAGTDGDLNGFFVQEEDADKDTDVLTSEGLFIFDGDSPTVNVAKGDLVTITGRVIEFYGLTQLTDVAVTVDSSGNALPTASSISLPGDSANLEALEGTLVEIENTLTITEYFNYDRFGEIRLFAGDTVTAGLDFEIGFNGRPYQYTQLNAPSIEGYAAFQAELETRAILLDDGRINQNPTELHLPDGSAFSSDNSFRGGDQVTWLGGVLSYTFGEYRIQPVEDLFDTVVISTNPRRVAPEDVGGSLSVASFNVLNFFTTIDSDPDARSGPNRLEPRGADSVEEFERQLEKLTTAIAALDADILGLIELENEFSFDQNGDGRFAIEVLVDSLNSATGRVYAPLDPGRGFVDTGDAISNGFIYDTQTVEVTYGTSIAILDDSILPELDLDDLGPLFDGTNTNRASLAATFTELSTGGTFTVAVNHFKSKGGTGEADDADIGDGQGAFNGIRTGAARALAEWLETDPTGSGDEDFMIIGDLNSYAMEDPITVLKEAGYIDVFDLFSDGTQYSFLFDGTIGTLDYGLVNGSLAEQLTGATKWPVNADEPDILDYNLDFGRLSAFFDGSSPFRNSDHDPLLIGLGLDRDAAKHEGEFLDTGLGGTDNSEMPPETSNPTDAADSFIGTESSEVISTKGGNDFITASEGNDTIDGGSGIDRVSYDGNQNSYTVTLTYSGVQVHDRRTDGNGTDTLTNTEFLLFDDGPYKEFNLAQFGRASSLSEVELREFIELYIAYYNRAPDAIGLNFWGTAYANGTSKEEMATLFAGQSETIRIYPEGTSSTEFATTVYKNVLGRTPDQAGFDFWVNSLNSGSVSRDRFILEVLGGVAGNSSDRNYLDNKVNVGAYFAVNKGLSDTSEAAIAMALYDGSDLSIQTAKQTIDNFHANALHPATGDFLLPLLGLLDNSFQ